MKNSSGHYLHFTRKERNGMTVLLAMILLVMMIPHLYSFNIKESQPVLERYRKEILMLRKMNVDSTDRFRQESDGNTEHSYARSSVSFEKEDLSKKLYRFDPNTIDISGWRSLGVKERTATGIRRYIEKGGRFRQPEDIQKIWGLSDGMKERLLPYIDIATKDGRSNNIPSKYPSEKKPYEKKLLRQIDINKADTTALIALPGIGSKLAARIINFREKLGGFYSVSQVGETFGLPDSTFQKIRPYFYLSDIQLRRININTVALEELKQHPYIRWQLANVIIQYRLQHGNFTSVQELKKIMLIKEDIYDKIAPYIKVE